MSKIIGFVCVPENAASCSADLFGVGDIALKYRAHAQLERASLPNTWLSCTGLLKIYLVFQAQFKRIQAGLIISLDYLQSMKAKYSAGVSADRCSVHDFSLPKVIKNTLPNFITNTICFRERH